MKRFRFCAGLFLLGLLLPGLTSCIRTSTMVEVAKDGSGKIISRYYFSPQVKVMIDQMEAISANTVPGAPAGPPGMEGLGNFGILRDLLSPGEQDLADNAASYGEGVTYQSHEKGKDDEGWEGYTVTYAFEDINRVRIDQDSVPAKAKEFVESTGQNLDDKKGGALSFSLEDDTLIIHSSLAQGSMDELIDREKMEQARQMGMKPSQALQMAAVTMQGMRAGFFVRSLDGIAGTSATHATGNLIIMSDAEVSKVMQDPDFAAFLDKVAEEPDFLTEESVKELFGKLEAMTVELSEKVTLQFP